MMKRRQKIIINMSLSLLIIISVIYFSGYRMGVMGIERELNKNNKFESYDYFESDTGEAFLIGEHSNGRTVTFSLENKFGLSKILRKESLQ